MTATALSICAQMKTTLASRDSASYWGPVAKGVTAFSDAYFKTNLYPAACDIVGDANAVSGPTHVIDGINAARRGMRGGNLVEWIGAVFFTMSVTDVSDIACELGHCRGETESATVQVLNTVSDLTKALWTWDRVQEIRGDDYVKGAEGTQKSLAENRKRLDLARYAIWTVSAMSAVVFSYLSSQDNFFAKFAGSLAEDYAVSLVVNGVRGGLGLISFLIGLNLVGRAPTDGGYEDLAAAQERMSPQAAREAAKESAELNSFVDKVQYIVDDRKKTRSASKVFRLGLLVVENLSKGAGWMSSATSCASLSAWLKDKQSFCKLVAVPSWISTGIKNAQKHFAREEAAQWVDSAHAAKAWLDWGFAATYDVCAVPGYLFGKAGVELPSNAKWFLNEATRHWSGLFQAAALVVEFGFNTESKPHKGAAAVGARERFINGASHLVEGSGMDEEHWRDTLYLVDRISVVSMTALTLYRWTCDVRDEKFANFGSLMLAFDATKAAAGLAKDLWEDRDDSGYYENRAKAYLKSYGTEAA